MKTPVRYAGNEKLREKGRTYRNDIPTRDFSLTAAQILLSSRKVRELSGGKGYPLYSSGNVRGTENSSRQS